MRKIEYLSPTSIAQFYSDLTEFYLRYLADNRPPRMPQTQPMAVGSSFDAYVKSYLHQKIFGTNDPKFELTTLFEAQVEPHNRDTAFQIGKRVFDEYKKAGCLSDLMVELQSSITEPKFEFEVRGIINGQREGVSDTIHEVTFLGKPDLFYSNKEGAQVIHDWKVNGYYSKFGVSPMPGYVRIRDASGQDKGAHKDAICFLKKGVMTNFAHTLESLDEDWARQLCIYSWLCGQEVGGDFICSIDQVVCRPPGPALRFAEHRLKCTPEYQKKVFDAAQHVWEVCKSEWIFRNMDEEKSKAHCQLLEQSYKGGCVEDDVFSRMIR